MPQSDPIALGGDTAKELLLKFLEKSKFVNMTSIVEQPAGPGSSLMMQLKIVQDSRGRRSSTVLQPLSMQGVRSVDDGKRWINYYPDERRMIVQDAPEKGLFESAKSRVDLASQNYTFTMEKGVQLAGKDAATVIATPRAGEMPTRRFTIELSRCVLLRLEVKARNESMRTLFDTKAIAFPSSIGASNFEIKALDDIQMINVEPPVRLTPGMDVKSIIGFEPAFPKNLPFGFVARTPEITAKNCRMLAVQVTDGLAFATVYQFAADFGKGEREGAFEREVSGIRIRLVSDLPREVGIKLFEAFMKEASKSFFPYQEPAVKNKALKGPQVQATPPMPPGSRAKGGEDSSEIGLKAVVWKLVAAFMKACEECKVA